MEIQQDKFGNTLLYLSKEEWTQYGVQSGFMEETKTASNNDEILLKIASAQSDIKLYQDKIAQKLEEIENLHKGVIVEKKEEIVASKNKIQFDEENFPHLFAEQNKDGLIGPFKKTSPCV